MSGCRAGRAEILVDSSRRHLAVTDDKRVHMTTCCRGCCLRITDITQTVAYRKSVQSHGAIPRT